MKRLIGWIAFVTAGVSIRENYAHAYWAVLNMVTPDIRGRQPS
ncbi:hypothetical protein [Kribbella sp. NPDC051718]